MTDQLTLADAAWAAFIDSLAHRLERDTIMDWMFIAPAEGDAGAGLRIDLRQGQGRRLVGPRPDGGATLDWAEIRSDRLTQVAYHPHEIAETVVEIARQHWLLDHPDEIAPLGDYQPDGSPPPGRLGPDTLRRRVRDDIASFIGGAPVIGPNLIIRIPGADTDPCPRTEVRPHHPHGPRRRSLRRDVRPVRRLQLPLLLLVPAPVV